MHQRLMALGSDIDDDAEEGFRSRLWRLTMMMMVLEADDVIV
jgi:hypothetical protein